MAIGQVSPANQGQFGAFGAASLGAGLRVGLGTIKSSEEALVRIGEAREAAADAALERAKQARRDAEAAAAAERNQSSETTAAPGRGQAAARAQAVEPTVSAVPGSVDVTVARDAGAAQQASGNQVLGNQASVNQAPAPNGVVSGRGALFDLSV